jgi:hypothetical protein
MPRGLENKSNSMDVPERNSPSAAKHSAAKRVPLPNKRFDLAPIKDGRVIPSSQMLLLTENELQARSSETC